MNAEQKLHLQQMITANNVEDQTSLIRQLKHSHILRDDINALILLKVKHGDNLDDITLDAMIECNFLYTYYTDIFNKVKKDEIDLKILFKFLDVLRDIEDGKLGQHDGSYEIGMLLKQIYVDSALKKAAKLNAHTGISEPEYKGPQVDISWKQFKSMR